MNIRIFKFSANLVGIASLIFNTQVMADAVEMPFSQICSIEGAFGIRFGEKFSTAKEQADTFLFRPECYLITPSTMLPYFDTYAACVSEFDGKVYQVQAAKIFDKKVPQGFLSLSPTRVSSNRELGNQVLDGLLTQVPRELLAQVKVDAKRRFWELSIEGGVTVEVSNIVGWAVTFECRNEAKAA